MKKIREKFGSYELAPNGTPFGITESMSQPIEKFDSQPVQKDPATVLNGDPSKASSSNTIDESSGKSESFELTSGENSFEITDLVDDRATLLERDLTKASSSNVIEEPASKKSRLISLDDKFDEKWYENQEDAVRSFLDNALKATKSCNSKSWLYIIKLEENLREISDAMLRADHEKADLEAKIKKLEDDSIEMAALDHENAKLQAKIKGLEADTIKMGELVNENTDLEAKNKKLERDTIKMAELDHENADLKAKIKKLEEENTKLAKGKACIDCGKAVETVMFCNSVCQENYVM